MPNFTIKRAPGAVSGYLIATSTSTLEDCLSLAKHGSNKKLRLSTKHGYHVRGSLNHSETKLRANILGEPLAISNRKIETRSGYISFRQLVSDRVSEEHAEAIFSLIPKTENATKAITRNTLALIREYIYCNDAILEEDLAEQDPAGADQSPAEDSEAAKALNDDETALNDSKKANAAEYERLTPEDQDTYRSFLEGCLRTLSFEGLKDVDLSKEGKLIIGYMSLKRKEMIAHFEVDEHGPTRAMIGALAEYDYRLWRERENGSIQSEACNEYVNYFQEQVLDKQIGAYIETYDL